MAEKVKKEVTVGDVTVPGVGGAHMIDLLTEKLREALGTKKKDEKKKD